MAVIAEIDLDVVLARARVRRGLPEPALRRMLRERAGLSQEEIARLVGTTRPAVTRWETGQRTPRGETLERYVDLLNRLVVER